MNSELYKKYYNHLFKWCIKKTNNFADAEDLLQEINYQIIRAFSRDAIIIDEEKFIWKIAYYTWCKKIRDYNKRKNTLSLTNELENSIKDDTDILKQVEQDELKDIITKYISDMGDKMQKCITLYYYDDLSVNEIAIKLGMKDSLVKYYLYQARNKLKEELENEKIR